jgi:hypothetical protein
MGSVLTIHLGLHKTATTSLQSTFFPQATGYLGRFEEANFNAEHDEIGRRLVRIFWRGPSHHHNLAPVVSQLNFDDFPSMMLSNESLSIWPDFDIPRGGSRLPTLRPARGEKPRRGPHPHIPFLQSLSAALPGGVELRAVLTLRSQTTYLPSLAAQTGVWSLGRVVRQIIRHDDEFLFWDRRVSDLYDLLGEDKCLILLFEDGAVENAEKIAAFADLKPIANQFDFGRIDRRNVRGTGGGWVPAQVSSKRDRLSIVLSGLAQKFFSNGLPRLSRRYVRLRTFLLDTKYQTVALLTGGKVRRTNKSMARLEAYCEKSNRSLEAKLGRDLGHLGYPVGSGSWRD